MPKIKNIIIFLVIAAIFVFIYFYFIKKSPNDSATLVSTSSAPVAKSASSGDVKISATKDFLTLLLSVKNIKLNDAIFSDVAFTSLDGSHSITLTPDGNEGRPNPFAPIGSDAALPLVSPVNNPNAGAPVSP